VKAFIAAKSVKVVEIKRVEAYQDIQVDSGVLLPSQIKTKSYPNGGSLSSSSSSASASKREEEASVGDIPDDGSSIVGEIMDDAAPGNTHVENSRSLCNYSCVLTIQSGSNRNLSLPKDSVYFG
jgi:hypothetical protein